MTEHLSYFKELIEGRAELSWRAYLKKFEEELTSDFSRAQFLRLKFSPIEEIADILTAQKIEFHTDEKAVKKEKYYLTLSDDILDEQGKLKKENDNNILTFFYQHKIKETLEEINRELYEIDAIKDEWEKEQELSELSFFAEMELKYGNKELGNLIQDQIKKHKARNT